jgi:hypothetical protein
MKSEITPESIRQQRDEMRKALRKQEKKIARLGQEAFAPLKRATSRGELAARAINTGIALVDGGMLGMKLVNLLRRRFFS